MARTSRFLFVAGALLASASLAQAGDKGAFADTSQDARADLRPLAKPAPAGEARAPVADANPTGRDAAPRRKTRLARRAAAVAAAAPKASVPAAPRAISAAAPALPARSAEAVATAPAAAIPSAEAPSGKIEAAAPTPGVAAPGGSPLEKAAGTVSELLAMHARLNGVPLKLAQAVVTIESRGNARASHAGALGLMQIKYGTARAAGFSGPAVGLFAADTNLRYGMKILGEAYRAAGGDTCGALMRYQSGHFATHMNRANQIYCAKARAIMAGA